MSDKTCGGWYQDYGKIAAAINKCGVKRLREYCGTKKHPAKNIDRNIEIVKFALRYGTSAGVTKFGLSRQRIDQILRKYWKYAEDAIKEGKHDV